MIHLQDNKRIRPFDTLGSAIKHYRKKNGWTQIQLAQRLEVCQATIAHYEAGRVVPPLKMIKKLSRELECSLSLLVDQKTNFVSQE